MNVIKFTLAALLVMLSGAAFSQTQPCPPGQGCNDPNAVSATAVAPQVNVQPPPTTTLPSQRKTYLQPVDVVIETYVASVTVATRGPICVNWQGVVCPCLYPQNPNLQQCLVVRGRPDLGVFPGLYDPQICASLQSQRR